MPTPDRGHDPDWLKRPEEQFRDLPLSLRWELTRRHPTYLLVWQPARRHFLDGPFTDARDADLCRAASILLLGIGVAGEPVDPATPAERLLEGVGPEWLGGPVRPISLRALASMLYSLLPPAERRAVGEVFIRSASVEHAVPGDDPQCRLQVVRGFQDLGALASPALDRFAADRPLYYVHMDASQRSILEDMAHAIRRHHARERRPDRRTRTDAIPDGLEVWDLREGWTGAGYATETEKTLKEVAAGLGLPLTTVAARYQAGFRHVTGLDFTAERWIRLLAPLKVLAARAAVPGASARSASRGLSGRSGRPVPESTLRRGRAEDGERPGLVTGGAAVTHDFETVELLLDVETLARAGLSPAEIAAELEEPVDLIARLVGRTEEFRSLCGPTEDVPAAARQE